MYLISIYFDNETENRIRSYMKQIAKASGNQAMLDGEIPPHITIAAFQTNYEELAKIVFRNGAAELKSGTVQWVSLGTFMPNVIHISPVLNEYLYGLSEVFHKEISHYKEIQSDKRYQPMGWFPHTTLAKRMTEIQMRQGFETMQKQFGSFEGSAVRIGLSKTNPYRELESITLE